MVTYDTRGFLEKNKDPVSPDLISLLASSKSDLGKRLLSDHGASGGSDTARARGMSAPTKRSSLGGQFRQQLTKLVETLKATDPHFIRCIKPNSQKEKRVFDAPMTLTQLRYASV